VTRGVFSTGIARAAGGVQLDALLATGARGDHGGVSLLLFVAESRAPAARVGGACTSSASSDETVVAAEPDCIVASSRACWSIGVFDDNDTAAAAAAADADADDDAMALNCPSESDGC